MILYLETSALAKKHIGEAQSADVIALLQAAELIGAGLLTRVELPAAVAKAVRMNWLSAADGEKRSRPFRPSGRVCWPCR